VISAPNRGEGRAPRVREIRLVLLGVAIAALSLPASGGAYVYWANYRLGTGTTLGRSNLDGTGTNQGFITNTPAPSGLAVDGQHIYWANASANTIGRANLDGSRRTRTSSAAPALGG
jgi:hypothetical protein